MHKLLRLIHTVKYLKYIQVYFRLYYPLRRLLRKSTGFSYTLSRDATATPIQLKESICYSTLYHKNEFTLLNISHTFMESIDWNFSSYGKLWTYNLTYFDYLHQEGMTRDMGIQLINDFIENSSSIKDGLEPFPISLRGINWIKFLSKNNIKNQNINNSLYAQYFILMDNIEYHILGNHLLENGFSLLFGAYYFQNETFYTQAKKILIDELEEQILKDGAHFELSPMYHQIMLFRLLDCINLVQNNSWKEHELLDILMAKAQIMLGWLDSMTFRNGNIPLLNDSTNNIAPTTQELSYYASQLDIKKKKLKLSDCGYRKITTNTYEMIVDVGNIGPDYIPGHAHSDTFNFELYIDDKPFIVDTGLSTYETNARRTLERSTTSHNTVEIEGMDQSEVWGGFRVADRAYIVGIDESNNSISAIHDGYKKRLNILQQRKFLFGDKKIKIIDTIISNKEYRAIARLHFYPEIQPIIIKGGVKINDIKIKIKSLNFEINDYKYSSEFNNLINAKMLEIAFTKKLEIDVLL